MTREQCLPAPRRPPGSSCCLSLLAGGFRPTTATYQKAIQRCLQGQIGHSAEAYVDGIVVKTKHNDHFITNLSETFENLKKFKWKHNSTKCVFGVLSGKLLGFIVSNQGIEANPTKVNATSS